MKMQLLMAILSIVLILSVSNCGDTEDSNNNTDNPNGTSQGWCNKEPDQAMASAINQKLIMEVTGLFTQVSNSSTYPDYINDDGSVIVKGEYTTYPYYFKFIFSFKNYNGSYLSIHSGEVTYIDMVDDLSSIHYWQYKNGYFDITSDGEGYEVWWDFETYNSMGEQFTNGTFTICKSVYNYE